MVGEPWRGYLNAPVTVYRDEKLGVLQPLGISLESAALEEADPYPQSHREEAKQAVRQLQSRVQGLSEPESTALETLLFNFSDVISLNATWEEPMLCATGLTLRELHLSGNHHGDCHFISDTW